MISNYIQIIINFAEITILCFAQRLNGVKSSQLLIITDSACAKDSPRGKLQALVYDILPSATAVFSYAIGSIKLSTNKQFFVGLQTVVSLLQTTEIKQGVSFIAVNKAYTSTNKTTIVWIETELFSLPGVDASHVYVRALALGCFYSLISTGTFRRALNPSLISLWFLWT